MHIEEEGFSHADMRTVCAVCKFTLRRKHNLLMFKWKSSWVVSVDSVKSVTSMRRSRKMSKENDLISRLFAKKLRLNEFQILYRSLHEFCGNFLTNSLSTLNSYLKAVKDSLENIKFLAGCERIF